MEDSLLVLVTTASGVAAVHTLVGVDHSLPFVALARARGWSLRRLWTTTALCGVAHVLSSILLGTIGVMVGASLTRLAGIESARGELAAWLLVGFGLAYAAWAWTRSHRPQATPGPVLTTWTLFVVFVLGPCEPLIPLVAAGAAHSIGAAALVCLVFGGITVGAMLLAVTVGHFSLARPTFSRLEPYAHVLAGLAVAGSGLAVHTFGV